MRRFGPGLLGCLLATSLWAQSSSDMTREQAKNQQRVAQHQAEVQHLQQDVSRQESASKQAAERLQQQDRTIEELRKQLKATQTASGSSSAGH